ncbi:MAG: TVP38/TMEM64 family protein, partial [Paracoccaceae bacterium]
QAKLDRSHGTFTKIRDGIRANEIPFLFLMRLVPAFPFFAANVVPALVGVNLRNFVFTTFFGIIPGSLVYTWVGSGLGDVFARGEAPSLGIVWEWQILAPMLALCALAALPIIIKLFRKRDIQ